MLSLPEKKGDAPNACKGNRRVYYAADKRILTAAEPRNYIKLEKTDASPVECSHYGQNQSYSVQDHDLSFPPRGDVLLRGLFLAKRVIFAVFSFSRLSGFMWHAQKEDNVSFY